MEGTPVRFWAGPLTKMPGIIKRGMGLRNTLFLIIAILLAIMLILKIIQKDLVSIAILAVSSILILIVFLILKKQRENMLMELEQDLNKKVAEIKKRGERAKPKGRNKK